jgi:peptidoglycan/LPS O-acetylase OafA/YrhL
MTGRMLNRQVHIDALKVIASQLIVLHHFSAYGPLSDALSQASPRIAAWLYDYARMAVQVFLVLAGYLAVRSLAPEGFLRGRAPWVRVWQRYRRLALPFVVAMALAVASSLLARHWLDADFIPDAPTWGQTLAHAMLLHGVLGVDSLSAGAWYVAIDFQLFALTTLLLWLGRSQVWLARLGVMGLMLTSLLFLNRDAAWDNWALYFFGAYGLGAAAFWAARSDHPGWMLGLLAGTGLLALTIDFRWRIALALGTALLLGLVQWRDQAALPPGRETTSGGASRWIGRLGQSSYALFLVHFSVLMLGNAVFVRWGLTGAGSAALVLLTSWSVSMVLALWFERWVERG